MREVRPEYRFATLSATGVINDNVTLDGANISTFSDDPADLNIGADGSIIVGIPSARLVRK
jgi:hypothetical protein